MYHAARPERRKAVGGMLFSLALTSFLTGVTEPIEFSFMFLAWPLYVVHALLTGLSMALMDMLGVKLGFGFSAGLFDYVLNYSKSTRPWLLLPVGLAYGALYYGIFRLAIRVFDLKTPGRESEPLAEVPIAVVGTRGERFAVALGGRGNLVSVDACTTRLRLQVRDQAAVDEAALRGLGARGFVRLSPESLQVVLGPQADQVAGEIRACLAAPGRDSEAFDAIGPSIAAALPGADLTTLEVCDSRIRMTIPASAKIDEAALRRAGVRAIFRRGDRLHLLIGGGAPDWAAGLLRSPA
jgi:PTS system N-acetylglucosamine-specific IIC component